MIGLFRRTPKPPTALERAAQQVREEAENSFSLKKQALRDMGRRLGLSINDATDELIDTLSGVDK